MQKNKNLFLFIFFTLFLLSSTLLVARPTAIATSKEDAHHLIETAVPRTVQTANVFKKILMTHILQMPQTRLSEEFGFLALTLDNKIFQGIDDKPNSWTSKYMLPYLRNSKVMKDSLLLRKSARMVRYQITQAQLKKAGSKLSEDDIRSILNFMAQQIDSPLIVSPQPFFAGRYMSKMGPFMLPAGIEKVDPKTEQQLALATSLIVVQDLSSEKDTIFSVRDSLANDTLGLVVAHENGHGIMFDMYGKAFQAIERPSTNGHDAPIISDLGLSYLEGWAEAFEAIYGPQIIKLKEKDRTKYNVSEFLYSRQDPVRKNRYIWAKNHGKKDGVLKNALQMMSTEGVIATMFYDILTSRAINAPFEKSVGTMYLYKPMNFIEFVGAYIKLYPEDKKVITRIVLENTKYVATSNKAAELYKNYYTTKLSYLQKDIPQKEHIEAKRKYESHKENIFKEVISGKRKLFANVGEPLWFEGKIELPQPKIKLLDIKSRLLRKLQPNRYYTFRLDLNTVTQDALMSIGFSNDLASKIISDREEKGSFKGNPLAILKQYHPEVVSILNLKLYNRKTTTEEDEETLLSTLWPEDFERMSIYNSK